MPVVQPDPPSWSDHWLLPRNSTNPNSDETNQSGLTFILLAVGAIVFLLIIIVSYYVNKGCLTKSRGNSHGSLLPQKWRRWVPGANKAAGYDRSLQQTHRGLDAPSTLARSSRRTLDLESELPSLPSHTETEANVGNRITSGIDRNTSVRSVMTLPPYSAIARPTEQILGREGERAGVDMVIEFPETVEEEEARREDEMESLFQIRVARRTEQSEREEQRRLRREARDRGDWETYTELRRQARERMANAQTGARVSDQLIAEHQGADRSRRVSSVQYAEVGVARHDGTRLRANSTESDSRPLLDAASAIAGTSRPGSLHTLALQHSRGQSVSSVLSLSTMASDDNGSALVLTRTGASGRSSSGGITDFEIIDLSHSQSRSRASSMSHTFRAPSISIEGDLGESRIPQIDPPNYENLGWEDAPPYESPVNTRRPELPLGSAIATVISRSSGNSPTNTAAGDRQTPPRLPALETLPAIEVTASVTPVDEAHASSFRATR